ncbi:MAG: PAS domain S-box protein [Spirochaetales bacterium]|nr:PAS domain S-box protein [Spirochaetales bacterium]
MKNFVRKAIKKIEKLDSGQILKVITLLSDENEMLETILDSMDDGVIVTDLDHRINIVNKTAGRLLQLQTGDLHGRIVWAVVKDQETAEFIEKHVRSEGKILDEEFYTEKGAGTAILSLAILPYVKNKKIEGNILILRDVTEKKQREAQFRRAENLASLTTLAAGVAHEIKNPLSSIGIHIQLMSKNLNQTGCIDKESAEEYLEIIEEEIERLNGIVVDFLFAVRPMDTRIKSEDINKLSEDLIDFVKYELEENNIQIEMNLSPAVPKIEIDIKYMKQVLLNIIKNAIAAMPGGGILTISTFRKEDRVHLQIQDNGIGISDENMTKIFEPYFTTKDFGSGLGLTVVFKIIKEHGGEITLNSKEGEGTTFTISLPLPQSERGLLAWEDEK